MVRSRPSGDATVTFCILTSAMLFFLQPELTESLSTAHPPRPATMRRLNRTAVNQAVSLLLLFSRACRRWDVVFCLLTESLSWCEAVAIVTLLRNAACYAFITIYSLFTVLQLLYCAIVGVAMASSATLQHSDQISEKWPLIRAYFACPHLPQCLCMSHSWTGSFRLLYQIVYLLLSASVLFIG